MFDWLRKTRKAKAPSNDDWEKKVVWLPADHPDNSFKEEVLDCREVALGFWSATNNPDVAKSFSDLRKSDGRECVGKLPERAMLFDCELSFPYDGRDTDGCFFRARAMEDKWDFFSFDYKLYVRRSWTGRLIHVAECAFSSNTVRIHRIYSEPNTVFEDRDYGVSQLHFLIASHLNGKLIPFPIPPEFTREATKAIALMGFNDYGRRAQFATFARYSG